MMKSCLLWLNVLADLFRLVVLGFRSQSSLAAENLFLRKQLGFYQERKIKPRRTPHPAQGDADIAQPLVQLAQRIDGGDAQNLHRLAAQALPTLLA
jgi:hypothetical protein